MAHDRRRRHTQSRLNSSEIASCERLEDRRVLTTFGTPWPDARNLTVSFPTDDSSIGAYSNSLRSIFDQVTDRKEWMTAALRAFQTWSVHANINIGLSPDRGDAFGTVGLAANDPRFGEFRVGSFPQPGVLASALPYQQIAGTWSGDVLLNSQSNWFLGDWKSSSPVSIPAANDRGPAVELYTVLLHEVGNALGVADNNQSGTVMYTDYQNPKGNLTLADIAAIREIYGPRKDIYETTANNSRATATRILGTAAPDGQTPISLRGSLNTMNDVDFYRFSPLAGHEKVSVRLWASELSLLLAKIEVLDSRGVKIGDVKADSIFENNLELEVGSLNPSLHYFIKVSRNTDDVFAIGDYRIELDYRDPDQQPTIDSPIYDADANDDDHQDGVEYIAIDQLFSAGLVDTELGKNDSLANASVLETPAGFLVGSRYEAQASLSGATDRDFFQLTAPAFVSGVFHVDVSTVGTLTPELDVVVMNGVGDRVAATVNDKPQGSRTIQIANPVAGETYIIGIQAKSSSATKTGNYIVTADFSTEAAQMREMFSGAVQGQQSDYSLLQTGKSQLFRLDLSAFAATAQEGIQLTIYDAQTRDIVLTVSAGSGLTAIEYVWLSRGEYILRAEVRTRPGQTAGLVRYRVRADVISDDQGPNPVDPTQVAPTPDPVWTWTDSPSSRPPVIDLPPTIFEDPWLQELQLALVIGFYAGYYR